MLRKGTIVAGGLTIGSGIGGSAAAATTGKTTGGVTVSDANKDIKLSFTAHGSDHPKGIGGQWTARFQGSQDERNKGTIDCYTQNGNLAAFSGPVTQGNGARFIIYVKDNSGTGQPDKIEFDRSSNEDNFLQCPTMTNPSRTVIGGNLTVHD